MGGSARSRLLLELIIQSRRFGERSPDGEIFIALNEAELSARTGLARETISREIKSLKELGLMNVGRRGVTLYDIDRLGKELDPDS